MASIICEIFRHKHTKIDEVYIIIIIIFIMAKKLQSLSNILM
jgi:hypothetical protein